VIEWIMDFASEVVNGPAGRFLASEDDDDPYAVLKGDLFNGKDSPAEWRVIFTCVLILTFGSLAAGAGVGGGGLFVPIYAILLGVGGKPAVPLSKCTILGAAIGNFVDISRARHPTAERPLIDYEVSTFMQAGELLGVTIGVLLNLLLPEVVIMVFLACLLSFNAYKTILKGLAKYKKETEVFAKEAKVTLAKEGYDLAASQSPDKNSSDRLVELTQMDNSKTEDMERLHREQLEMIALASQEMRSFLQHEGLGHIMEKLQEFGVDSLTDLDDAQIITDSVLKAEIGIADGELTTLRHALGVRREEMDAALQPDYDAAFDLTNYDDDDNVCTSSPLVTSQTSQSELENIPPPPPSSSPSTSSPSSASARRRTKSGNGSIDIEDGSGLSKPSRELQKLLDDASIQFPVWAYVIVIAMTAYTIFYAIVKKDILNPCFGADAFWGWQFTPVPILGYCMYLIGMRLNKQHEARDAAGYPYLETDIMFTKEQLAKFPVTAVNAGLAAGLLGIGGGMVIGPLFIEIGMQPQVGTSSCAYMILWTAMSGVIQYYLAGKLGLQFVLFFACFGFVSGQLGQKGVNRILKRTGRPSIVVLLLGGIIGLACCVMTISTLVDIVNSNQSASEMFSLDLTWSKCSWWENHS
jgi:uncharacterized membrane protein YfcA